MARSDFNWVDIGHKFTVNAPTINKKFPVEGTQAPIDDAYLLFQIRGASQASHSIKINNKELDGFDIPPAPGNSQSWLVWMDRIPPNVLKPGTNEITITRKGNDDFEIKAVVVNWRENG